MFLFHFQAPLDHLMMPTSVEGHFSLAMLQQTGSAPSAGSSAAPAAGAPAATAPAATTGAPPLAGEGTTTAPGGPAPQTGAPPSLFGGDMMFFLLPVIVILILMTVLGPHKEQKRRNTMLKSMKKHDRVQTVGGVIGSITEIKSDTIVLKVDETSNTRMTFSRDAVQQILETESAS